MNKMNKFKKSNSINKNIFSTNPPSKIMNKPEIKQDPVIQIPLIEEPLIEKSLIEPLIEEVKTITINQLSKNDLKLEIIKENCEDLTFTFPDIYENIEIIPDKNDLNNKPIPKMKLIVDEVILNMKKKKLNGWKIN